MPTGTEWPVISRPAFAEALPQEQLPSTPRQCPGCLGSGAFQTSALEESVCQSVTSLVLFTVPWPLPLPLPSAPVPAPWRGVTEVLQWDRWHGPSKTPAERPAGPGSRASCFGGVTCYFRKNSGHMAAEGDALRGPGWKAGLRGSCHPEELQFLGPVDGRHGAGLVQAQRAWGCGHRNERGNLNVVVTCEPGSVPKGVTGTRLGLPQCQVS